MWKQHTRIATGLVTVMTVTLFASACGNSASGSSKELTLWSMWAKGEVAQKFEQAQIDEFTKQTGIKVNVQWKGRGVISALLPSLNTGAPPTDLVEGNVNQIAVQLGPTGGLKDRTDFYTQPVPGGSKTVADVVGANKSAAEQMADSGKLGPPLAVPYWVSAFGIYYNAARFPQLEQNPPATWEQFVKILDAEKAKGVKPLALDGSLDGYSWRWYESLARSIVGNKAISDAVMDKSGKAWTNPGFLDAARKIEALVKGGYFIDGYDSSKFPAMENAWADNKSDFIMMGTWLPAEVAPVVADGFKFRVFPFPPVSGHPVPATTVTPDGYAVMKSSEKDDAAEKFIAFMLSKRVQAKVASDMQEIPIMKGVAAPPSMQGIKPLLDNGGVAQDRVPDSAADFYTKVLYPDVGQLVLGKITAAQFIPKLQADAASYWKQHS